MVSQCFTNPREQINSDARLENVPYGPDSKTRPDKIWIRMHSQKNNLRGTICFPQLIDSFDAIHHGHRNVGDDDIRLEIQAGLKQGAAISHDSNNFKRWPQKPLYNFQKLRMVISQQNSYFVHLARPLDARWKKYQIFFPLGIQAERVATEQMRNALSS